MIFPHWIDTAMLEMPLITASLAAPHRSRVVDVDTGVGTGVDSGDHQIRRGVEELI